MLWKDGLLVGAVFHFVCNLVIIEGNGGINSRKVLTLRSRAIIRNKLALADLLLQLLSSMVVTGISLHQPLPAIQSVTVEAVFFVESLQASS
jgi:hypothetical protein